MKKILFMLLMNCSLLFAQNNWEIVYNTDDPYFNIWGLESYAQNTVSATGNNGFFIISKDTGQTWKEVYLGTNAQLWDISYVDEQNIWICGYKGTIVKYNSNENKYFDFSIDSKYDIKSICFVNNLTGLAGSKKGIVFMTKNGGKTWDSILFTRGFELTKIRMKNSKEGYILCSPQYIKIDNKNVKNKDSRIYKTLDGGLTWKVLVDIKDEDINNILFNDNNIWIVGFNGLIIKSSDGGITWEWLKKDFNENIWSMVLNKDEIYVAAGWQNYGIGKSSFNSKSFELDFDSQGTTIFRLTGNGEYLFTEISDGRIDGIHEILRKKIR